MNSKRRGSDYNQERTVIPSLLWCEILIGVTKIPPKTKNARVKVASRIAEWMGNVRRWGLREMPGDSSGLMDLA